MKAPGKKTGVTWTELLVLIAVVGFLAAVLVPNLDRARSGRTRSVNASNIRQIGQASLIYANDNREELPGLHLTPVGEIDAAATTRHLHAIAAALARSGGLNDANVWIVQEDENPDVVRTGLSVVLHQGSSRVLDPVFEASATSYQYVAGLTTEVPSTIPIAFTRGLQRDGRWASDRTTSVFGSDGGHIVFLGGNVQYFKTASLADYKGDGATSDVLEAVGSDARIFSEPPTDTGWLRGLPGIDP